jgi:alkaline phosphatase
VKRRDFVRSGVAGIAGGVIGTPSMLAAGSSSSLPRGGSADLPVRRARNIIFFAYDGFSHEDLGTARYFAQRHLGMDRLAIEELLANGASGLSLTHSADSVVTDSAAASSAWASGVKLLNGRIGVDADGRPLTRIMELARRQGRATGLITSARITHATPAGWVASVVDRNDEDQIASALPRLCARRAARWRCHAFRQRGPFRRTRSVRGVPRSRLRSAPLRR